MILRRLEVHELPRPPNSDILKPESSPSLKLMEFPVLGSLGDADEHLPTACWEMSWI